MMPAWGDIIGEDGVRNVAAYVVTELSGRKLPEGTKADIAAGQKVFAANCVACHGPEGHGTPAMGAPNLTRPDAFIYGTSYAQIQHTVRYGRQNAMPAQAELQGNDKVHLLAAYVYSLSHGDKAAE
ncbi:Cbb3-type cytochrome c oxidase subunit CcoP2 [compost metagenome]